MVDDIQTPCIYCGSLRSPADAVCPSCGEGWIDEHVTPPPPEQVDLHNIDEELIDDAAPDGVSDERGSLESSAEATLADTDTGAGPWGNGDTGVDAFDEEDDAEEEDINTDFSMGNEADVEEDDLDDPEMEDDEFEDEAKQYSDEIDGDKDLDAAGDGDEALEEGQGFDEVNEQQEGEDFAESDEEMSETVTLSSIAADVTMTPVRSMHERKDSNLRLPLGILAAAALAIIAWLSWFQGTDTPPTTSAVVAQATATQAPSTTTQPTTSTSTTTSTTTSSTTTSTTLVPIAAIGSPLNLADLTMGGFAFGPFSFGSDGDQVLGRLTATLGQPDALGPADTNWGLCEADVGTVVTWGGIAAIFRVQNDVSRFVGYRVGDTTGIDETDAGTSLKTLSGVTLGDTVETLRFVYANSVVEVFDRDGQPYFRLLRSDTKRLLLYGPISLASDDGAILGIFAPDACGA